jgi:hypothetical protein
MWAGDVKIFAWSRTMSLKNRGLGDGVAVGEATGTSELESGPEKAVGSRFAKREMRN